MKESELLRRYQVNSSSVVCFENSESLEQHTTCNLTLMTNNMKCITSKSYFVYF